MDTVKMAQFGTKHGHASGKLKALLDNPQVELAGVYEADTQRREEVANEAPYSDVHWFGSAEEALSDESIVAVASEGSNRESLAQTEMIVRRAGKHVWYDKPAGDDWAHWLSVAELAREKRVYIQMGYMFRYHHAFRMVAELARGGVLGQVFEVRAHMSTWLTHAQREKISAFQGGIFYDLAAHMLDQIVWTLGRPRTISSFFRNDATTDIPAFEDNTVAVLEFDRALAIVDIAAMEPRPMARRYEVYGTRGSAIITEPFEPAKQVRLVLEEPAQGYAAGEHAIDVPLQSRQDLYELELDAFLATIREGREPDRTLEHESLVQETLLRAVGLLE